jgi:hypothetical protein
MKLYEASFLFFRIPYTAFLINTYWTNCLIFMKLGTKLEATLQMHFLYPIINNTKTIWQRY